jgi:hypothetical protein
LIAEEESFVVAVEGSVAAVVGRAGADVKNNNFFSSSQTKRPKTRVFVPGKPFQVPT